jgi:hypothetical protein
MLGGKVALVEVAMGTRMKGHLLMLKLTFDGGDDNDNVVKRWLTPDLFTKSQAAFTSSFDSFGEGEGAGL